MSTDERYDEATVELVATALCGGAEAVEDGAGIDRARSITREVLNALADAGLLLPPGGKPGVWWRVRGEPGHGFPLACGGGRVRFLVALQRIGCSHPCQVEVGTFAEPYVHWCVNPNCGAKWQETEWRKQVWPR